MWLDVARHAFVKDSIPSIALKHPVPYSLLYMSTSQEQGRNSQTSSNPAESQQLLRAGSGPHRDLSPHVVLDLP